MSLETANCRKPEHHELHTTGAALRCARCHGLWAPSRVNKVGLALEPESCPKCSSPYWDRPKMTKKARSEYLSKSGRERAKEAKA